MSTMPPNPYNPQQPTDHPAYFFGRGEAFAFFRQNLVGASHRRALVIIGRRGLGKSSLLRQLGAHLDERHPVCVVALEPADLTGAERVISVLAEAIRLTLDAAGASTYRLPDWPPAETSEQGSIPPDAIAWFFGDFLEITMAALRTRNLVLALDDAHLLLAAVERGTLPQTLLHRLAEALEQHDRLALVCALDAAYEDQAMTFDLLADPTLHYRLHELSPSEAEQLVRVPLAEVADISDDIVEQVLALGGTHPFLLQAICRLLYRRSEERHHAGPIMELDLTASHAAALDQADDIFRPLWEQSSQNERLTLTGLVMFDADFPGGGVSFSALHDWAMASGVNINKTQLAAALRSLDYNGLVRTEDGELYALTSGLIAGWVRAVADLPERDAAADSPSPAWTRYGPLVGLGAVLLIVALLGIASLSGVFDDDDEQTESDSSAPTATLAIDIAGTEQAVETEQALLTQTAAVTPASPTPAATTPAPSPAESEDAPDDAPDDAPTGTPDNTPEAESTDEPE